MLLTLWNLLAQRTYILFFTSNWDQGQKYFIRIIFYCSVCPHFWYSFALFSMHLCCPIVKSKFVATLTLQTMVLTIKSAVFRVGSISIMDLFGTLSEMLARRCSSLSCGKQQVVELEMYSEHLLFRSMAILHFY